MCGIFGTVKAHHSHNRMLTIFNEDRGSDSVGILFDGNRVRCDRAATKAIMDRGLTDRVFMADVFLGHTRSKTHGAALKRNAHPFRYGNIVGAHNGVVSNFFALKFDYKAKFPDREREFKDMDVDSQIIFWLLNEKGTDGLKELDCYAAIWWQDLRQPDKFFTWTWGNQYAVCENVIGEDPVLAFSSDPDHLKLAGFKNPVVIPGDGIMITYDTKTAREVARETIHGQEKRKRGDWRQNQGEFGYGHNYGDGWSEDDRLAAIAGVPAAYRGQRGAGNPTQGQGTTTALATRGAITTPVIDNSIYDKFFFCEKCNHVLPHDVITSSSQHDKTCPKCGGAVEGIHVTDAEWFFENMPECIPPQEEINGYKLMIKKEDTDEQKLEGAGAGTAPVDDDTCGC